MDKPEDVSIKLLLKKLLINVLVHIIMLSTFAILFMLFFPLIMGIIAIEWPEWAVNHSGKFTSWFCVLVTIDIIIRYFHCTLKDGE